MQKVRIIAFIHMRDEFNEISFILNIWLFKSTQNLKKKKKRQNKIIVKMMIITPFLLHLLYTQNYMD